MKFKMLIIPFLLIFIVGCTQNEDDEETLQAKMSENYDRKFTLSLNETPIISMQRNSQGFDIDKNNKAILFVFFTTWCDPCNVQIPHLINLQNKYQNELSIVGILMEPELDNDRLGEFMNDKNINYVVANGESNFFFAKVIADTFEEEIDIPFLALYQKNGEYVTSYVGIVPEEMIESDIKGIL